jgi:tRNA(Ile)-lysidine synthase
MINDSKKEFLNFIKEKELINVGEGIVIGLSGGPDSVCLLNLLCSIREELDLKLAAVHINHMIRGEAADGDELYARELCEKLQVNFYSKRIDINKYAKENKLSSEAAGREVRYEYFNKIMEQLDFNKIATAHNANDQAETILMRVMRGTGLEGLGGIPVKRDNVYIRPILFMKRGEVERYCEDINLKPRIDSTNSERNYSRNKVRLDILPYMQNNFNSDVIEAINRMGLLLQSDNKYIQGKVEEVYNKVCNKDGDSVVINANAFEYEQAIINRVIRRAIGEFSGNKYDLEMKHIQEIFSLILLGTNKRIDLPRGLYAINIYGDIHIRNRQEVMEESSSEMIILKEDILYKEVSFDDYLIEFQCIQSDESIDYDENSLRKYFNYDKISGNIVIRHRRNGDIIVPLGMKGKKKVKDIFIDMKIPKLERDSIPIIQFGEDISWIVGIKMSDRYKIDKQTKNILRILVKRKES